MTDAPRDPVQVAREVSRRIWYTGRRLLAAFVALALAVPLGWGVLMDLEATGRFSPLDLFLFHVLGLVALIAVGQVALAVRRWDA